MRYRNFNENMSIIELIDRLIESEREIIVLSKRISLTYDYSASSEITKQIDGLRLAIGELETECLAFVDKISGWNQLPLEQQNMSCLRRARDKYKEEKSEVVQKVLNAIDNVLFLDALLNCNSVLCDNGNGDISFKKEAIISIIKAVDINSSTIEGDIEFCLAKVLGVPADNSVVKAIVTEELVAAVKDAAKSRDDIVNKQGAVKKIIDMILKQLNKVCPYIKDAFTKHLDEEYDKLPKTHLSNLKAKVKEHNEQQRN